MIELESYLNSQKINKIVALTGAGFSAESGIKTFRDENGLWENHEITTVASPEGFHKDPELVHRFYNARRKQLREVEPNPAHFALAQLADIYPDMTIITQNVDDLHERAGSKNVLHMHGELRKIKSLQDNTVKVFHGEVKPKDFNLWRPDIVWFGEMIKYAKEIEEHTLSCDLFLCMGTSNNVYPAAGLVNLAKQAKALSVEVNLEPTALSYEYGYSWQGLASVEIPKLVDLLMRLK